MTVIISGRAINDAAAAEAESSRVASSVASDGGTTPRSKKFPVVEIFGPTVQGEGALLGVQTMFVRFGGCDYRCTQCDSLHSVLPELVKKNAVYMDAKDIAAVLQVSKKNTWWVTLSGGNPAMHNLAELIQLLHMDGMKVSVETQGTIWQHWFMQCDQITISPKGPGMGEEFEPDKFDVFVKHLYSNVRMNWSVKFVIMNAIDLEFAKSVMERWKEPLQGRVFLSLGNPFPPPAEGTPLTEEWQIADMRVPLLDVYVHLVDIIMEDDYFRDCKITPQLHVLFWGNKQGV